MATRGAPAQAYQRCEGGDQRNDGAADADPSQSLGADPFNISNIYSIYDPVQDIHKLGQHRGNCQLPYQTGNGIATEVIAF